MMFFGAGRPCPYAETPCIALNRFESELVSNTSPLVSGEKEKLRRLVSSEVKRNKCETIYTFGGQRITANLQPHKK